MAENSAIEWCDATFNPWIGCTKVSDGCLNCYAAAQDSFRKWTPAGWGAGHLRKRTSAANWRQPVKWNASEFVQCANCGWRGEPIEGEICHGCGRLALVPARRRVFCASLADVFDNEVAREWRADLFTLIRTTPHLDWLLLTKRIGNTRAMIEDAMRDQGDDGVELAGWPWPNVWLGATVVNQEEADRDVPKLLATPARVRFLSCEPLLGPVSIAPGLQGGEPRYSTPQALNAYGGLPTVDWVIVGGESGPGARPMHLQWVRDIVRQCHAAGVPVLVKQLGREVLDHGTSSPGEHWPASTVHSPVLRRTQQDPGFIVRLADRKGGDWAEWPEDLRMREFPEVHA